MNTKYKNLNNFFYPKTLCLVGASTKEKSIGYELLNSIKSFGYKGKVFPVNPKAKNVLGYNCFKSISHIKNNIDLAIIVVRKEFVEASIDELIDKNVSSIILITAGFKETGIEGEEAEKRILNKIKNHSVRLVGPNCMGIINTLERTKLNATFVAEKPETGSIGFLSQSGALGAAVLNSLRETNIKFAHFISVGNKADINENDILSFWHKDKNIKVLTFYLESFENGFEFLQTYTNQKKKKPVIILKAGKTKSGMKAASSHTGALSSNDKIVNSLLKQFGIIRTDNLNELFNTAKGFEFFPLPKGNRIAVVTNAGGPAILAVDKLDDKNLVLSEFSQITKKRLRKIIHPEGSINNPVDLLPGGSAETYQKVTEVLLKDKNVDAVISIFVEPVMVNAFDVIETINSIKSGKPVYQVCMPLPEFWKTYKEKSKYKIPIFKQPEEPAEIISNILLFKEKKSKEIILNNKNANDTGIIGEERFLNQLEISKLCKQYKLPIVKQLLFTEKEINENNNFNFPVVLKGISESVIHKTEMNAVKLNVKNKKELLNAIKEIKNSFKQNGFEVEKYLLQPFIKTKHELLIGGVRDSSFGPIIMFGSGGKYVEIFEDVAIRSAYLTEREIEEMIAETKIGKILQGVRNEKSVDIIKLGKVLKSVAKMMIENKEILEFDINPMIVDEENKFYAVDVRIKVEK